MKPCISPKGLLWAIIVLLGAALYEAGNYVVDILTYSFSFSFLLCYALSSASAIREKILQTIVYALILAAQILFAVLVVRPADCAGQPFDPYRLLGVLIILVPFLVKRLWSMRA